MLLCFPVRFLDLESFLGGGAGSPMKYADAVVAKKEAAMVDPDEVVSGAEAAAVEEAGFARFFTGALLEELSLLTS